MKKILTLCLFLLMSCNNVEIDDDGYRYVFVKYDEYQSKIVHFDKNCVKLKKQNDIIRVRIWFDRNTKPCPYCTTLKQWEKEKARYNELESITNNKTHQ